ncbi:hypothetical protein GCM10022243_42490 [Saccharothrix violaceirubra]|uniref:Uncharacterized protein n=1 Tax=Saccharothrix violaceirubra TaxID=413306 RepID=A0A7W7WWF8_9PSEU|nr:hypothetical protein [Saccharothrix violaceirubra]MBB4965538.1 hypothetical protein [Saccharothrix violaceirubra]
MRIPQLIAVLVVGLVAAACGPDRDDAVTNGETAADTEALPTGAHELVLRMDYSPGFARVPETAPFPAFSLYGDGRIVTADIDVNAPAAPGGWQRARELRTDSAGIRRLVRAAHATGLQDTTEPSGTASTGTPADATSARFVLLDGKNGRHSRTVAAPEAHGDARGELFRALSDPAAWLGGTVQTAPYRADALAVLRRDEPASDPAARPWPVGALDFPGTRLGSGQRVMTCVVLHGESAAAVTARAADVPQYSPWTDGSHTATLELRPLLPDENDCPDLPGPPR